MNNNLIEFMHDENFNVSSENKNSENFSNIFLIEENKNLRNFRNLGKFKKILLLNNIDKYGLNLIVLNKPQDIIENIVFNIN